MQKIAVAEMSTAEYDVIYQLVHSLIDVCAPAEMLCKLQKTFGPDIQPRHYIVFGFLIGELLATEHANENLIYYQCQRLN